MPTKSKGRATRPSPEAPRLDAEAVAEAIGIPFEQWRYQCHTVSLAIVKEGLVEGRVVRGSCNSVFGQHSWIVPLDFYDGLFIAKDHWIIDPTLWSYDSATDGIWYGNYTDGRHRPHGAGSIWDYGKPYNTGQGEVIELTPSTPLSGAARAFLDMAVGEPLDLRGWSLLVHSPVEGWPAREILTAVDETKALCQLTPIDIIGNYTDRNPQGLYLKGDDAL